MIGDDEEKKVEIEVIETPRGPVPTAESIKELFRTWNSLVSLMNDNLKNIFNQLSKIDKSVMNLANMLSKLITKFDVILEYIAKIRVDIENISNEIKKFNLIMDQNKGEFKKIGSGDKEIDLKELIKYDLLKEKSKSPKKDFKKFLKPVSIESTYQKRLLEKKQLSKKMKEGKIFIFEGSIEEVLKVAAIYFSKEGFECYLFDPVDIGILEAFNLLEDFMKEKKKMVIFFKNAEDVIGNARFVLDPRISVKVSEIIKKILEKDLNVVLVFQTKNVDKIDPIFLKESILINVE